MEWDPDIDFFDLPAKPQRTFLRKGEGKLASHRHGTTEFALKRRENVIIDQLKTEKGHHQFNKGTNDLVEKYLSNMSKGEPDDKNKKDAWK